ARRLRPELVRNLDPRRAKYILEKEHIYHRLRRCDSILERGWAVLGCLAVNPGIVARLLRSYVRGERPLLSQAESLAFVHDLIRRHGLEKNLVPV
ncbi:MAG: hypothetical protein V1750_08385, partial [Acidobacteriota bacterium]